MFSGNIINIYSMKITVINVVTNLEDQTSVKKQR